MEWNLNLKVWDSFIKISLYVLIFVMLLVLIFWYKFGLILIRLEVEIFVFDCKKEGDLFWRFLGFFFDFL